MLNHFLRYIGKNFGKPSGMAGKTAAVIMNAMNQKQYRSVLENINLRPKDCILDIGFGNGYLINKLCRQKIPISIYGIEISADMFREAVRKNKKENCKPKLFWGNIDHTAFNTNMFNTIYTVNTFYFWKNPARCFAEIKRILKPDGLFINVIYSKNHLDKIAITKFGFSKYTVEELEQITAQSGLKIIKIVEIQKNKSYCVLSKNVKTDIQAGGTT